jgi:uncharacterized membrane protein
MWGKIARWLLPASLALNLFFAVLAFRHHPFLHPHPPDFGHVVDFMKPNLPPADAEILQKSFEAHKAAMDDARKAGQDFPEKIRAALTASPFNPDALKQALKDGQAGHQGMEDAMAAAFVEAATKMSPEGRAALAARHQFGPGMRGPGGPGNGPGGSGGPGFPPHDGPPPPPGPPGPPPPPN